MKKEKSNNFIINEEFFNLIKKYQDETITKKENDKLGEIVLSLVNHYAMKPNFSNYTYLDEMKSNAFYTIWKNLGKFNREKSENPFSYFTQACHNAFIFVINKEKQIQERSLEFAEDQISKAEAKSEISRYAKKKYTSEIKNNKFEY